MDKYLYILPLIFSIMAVIGFVTEIYSDIKSKNVIGIISDSIFLGIVIILTILYIKIISYDKYEINIDNMWIKIMILLYIATQILMCYLITKLRKYIKIYVIVILIVVYSLLFIVFPFIVK